MEPYFFLKEICIAEIIWMTILALGMIDEDYNWCAQLCASISCAFRSKSIWRVFCLFAYVCSFSHFFLTYIWIVKTSADKMCSLIHRIYPRLVKSIKLLRVNWQQFSAVGLLGQISGIQKQALLQFQIWQGMLADLQKSISLL